MDYFLTSFHDLTTLFTSVADPDPGSGAFLTPGSGILNKFFSRISDPESQTYLVTIFWLKIINIVNWLTFVSFPVQK